MVGDKLVEDVVLVLVVVISDSIGIDVVLYQIVYHVLNFDFQGRLAQESCPYAIRFRKEGETYVSVLGRIECLAVSVGVALYAHLDGSLLVEFLIYFIAPCHQGVQQAYGPYQLGCHIVAFFLVVDDVCEQEGHGVVAGSHHIVHTLMAGMSMLRGLMRASLMRMLSGLSQ